MPGRVFSLFLFRSLVCLCIRSNYRVWRFESRGQARRRVDINCICCARLHLRAMNCFARLDLRVCMRDGSTGRDRSTNSLLNFSHAINRRLSFAVDFTCTYMYVSTSTNQRCDPAMPLAGHSFCCVCSLT